jgi:hypothetical protein
MNLQTSFLTPPFGFALFYLRSVAPAKDFIDRVTKLRVPGVKTMEIYRGSVPFVLMQLVMVVVLMVFPGLVTFTLDKKIDVDLNTIEIRVDDGGAGANVEGDAGWGAQGDSLGGDAGAGQPATAGDAPAPDGQGTAAGNDGAAPQRGW